MTARRTKKQKESAKHTFTFQWTPSVSSARSEANVKREFPNEAKSTSETIRINKETKFTAKDANFTQIRRDLIKSLILASLILASEVVIYLVLY